MEQPNKLHLTVPQTLIIFVVFLSLGFGSLGIGLGWMFYDDRGVAEKALRIMQEERDREKGRADLFEGYITGMVITGVKGRPALVSQLEQLTETIESFRGGLERQGKIVKGEGK